MSLSSRLSRAGRADEQWSRIRAALDGKVVAITGGARGIGYEIAGQVLAAGGRVALGDVDVDAVEKAAADLGVEGLQLDVTDSASFETFFDSVERRLGPVDVLINNAGIMPVGPFLDFDESLIRSTIDIDLVGVILGCRAAGRRMVGRGGGQIVNVASIAGRLPMPGLAVYNGAKSGVIEFSEAIDHELSGTGVRVSTVMPTFTRTGLVTGLTPNKMIQTVEPEVVAHRVLRSIAEPTVRAAAPWSMGWVDAVPSLSIGFKRTLTRLTKVDTVFLHPDSSERKAYSERIGQGGPPGR
ncbi:SDR family NAD(P)-dependent oxidoreductase [Gordonia zhaorongruii]|uniref:SDR family NAD(P)-dependent oxidoreductase n=1 Tax=Gordonia zhaorongruii TaxID=2597659 RepID=UPI001042E7C2|nr:SDR family NAD(P)-dependent oxidoreductase [Gordonia zhaorongruii]